MSKYPPPHHLTHDRDKMISVMRHFPLATVISADKGLAYATHIPVIYNDTTGKLVAHMDRSNPQLSTFTNGSELLVVFNGPDAYISPSIYEVQSLPTWNHIIVHVRGTLKLITNEEAAKETLISMTEFLEAPNHKYRLTKDNERMQRLIDYIVAFEIDINHWEGKFKLSQDKRGQDFLNAKEVLIKKSGEDATGFIEEMYKSME